MKRRNKVAGTVPAELLDRDAWKYFSDWTAARDEWVEAGNEWPGGEEARQREESDYLKRNVGTDRDLYPPIDWSLI